jgi:hypothetical protein
MGRLFIWKKGVQNGMLKKEPWLYGQPWMCFRQPGHSRDNFATGDTRHDEEMIPPLY